MAILEHKRLRPGLAEDDIAVAKALQQMTDYTPSTRECVLPEVTALAAAVEEARTADIHAANQAAVARNKLIAIEWEFHNRIIAVKNQVRAQYGVNSNEVQMIGLKRAATRKLPGRRNGRESGTMNGNGQKS